MKPICDFHELPGPRQLPLLGNLHQINASQFHINLEEWAGHYGPFYKLRFGGRSVLVISDSQTISLVLKERPNAIDRSSRSSQALSDVGIAGILTANGEDWLKQRKLVMRAFTPGVIHSFFPTLARMTERLMRRWEKSIACRTSLDLLRDIKAFALDVTVGIAMGQDINTLENHDNPLQRDIEYIFGQLAKRLSKPFPYWRYIKLPEDRAVEASAKQIKQAITEFIAQARQRMQDNPDLREHPTNMLEALIAARDEIDSGVTDAHVIGNAVTMVFSGEDTTSSTIAWLVYFLACHPDIAVRVSRETDTVLQDDRVLRSPVALNRFPYMDAVVQEVMRLKTAAPFISLEANKEIELAGIRVPAGTLIIPLLRYVGQNAAQFPNPARFEPNRWIDMHDESINGGPSARLFFFGGGPRFCPGRYLALAELKVVVSMLVRNFTIKLDADAPPVKEIFSFLMTPSALPVSLLARNKDF